MLPWTRNTIQLIIVLTPEYLHSCLSFYTTLFSHSRGCLFRALKLGALIAYSDILSAHPTSRFFLLRSFSFLARAIFLQPQFTSRPIPPKSATPAVIPPAINATLFPREVGLAPPSCGVGSPPGSSPPFPSALFDITPDGTFGTGCLGKGCLGSFSLSGKLGSGSGS